MKRKIDDKAANPYHAFRLEKYQYDDATYVPIRGMTGYEVNAYGVVRNATTKRPITRHVNCSGLHYVNVSSRKSNGEVQSVYRSIPDLVAQHFLPMKQDIDELLVHLDGNRDNCHKSNLAWLFPSEIVPGMARVKQPNNGRHSKKLTEEQVDIILARLKERPYTSGEVRAMGKEFGVSGQAMYWNFIKDDPAFPKKRGAYKRQRKGPLTDAQAAELHGERIANIRRVNRVKKGGKNSPRGDVGTLGDGVFIRRML